MLFFRHFPEFESELPGVPVWVEVKYLDAGFVR